MSGDEIHIFPRVSPWYHNFGWSNPHFPGFFSVQTETKPPASSVASALWRAGRSAMPWRARPARLVKLKPVRSTQRRTEVLWGCRRNFNPLMGNPSLTIIHPMKMGINGGLMMVKDDEYHWWMVGLSWNSHENGWFDGIFMAYMKVSWWLMMVI